MTDICHLHLTVEPVAHGFRPGLRARRPIILPGRDPAHADQLAGYQRAVRRAAARWLDTHQPIVAGRNDPVVLAALFAFEAPRRTRTVWRTSRRGGDLTTLTRAPEDALTHVLYTDDARVVTHLTAKIHAPEAAVDLWIGHADQLDTITALWAQALNAHRPERPSIPTGPTGTAETAAEPADQPPVISEASTSETCSRSIPALSSPFPYSQSLPVGGLVGVEVVGAVDDSLMDWGGV